MFTFYYLIKNVIFVCTKKRELKTSKKLNESAKYSVINSCTVASR